MKTEDQRSTKKDAVFDNVKIINTNRIPLATTLDNLRPYSGSLISLRSGSSYDFYYGNGLEWVQLTSGDLTNAPTLLEVLGSGNVTGGNNIVITNGDLITSEPDGAIRLTGTGSSSLINLLSQGQLLLESDRADLSAIVIRSNDTDGGVLIESGTAGRVDIDAGSEGADIGTTGQLVLTSSQAAVDAIRINASNAAGGIDIDAGGGIDIDAEAQLALTSLQAETDAIRINAPNGGIDIDSGSLQIAINSGNNLVLAGDNTVTLVSSSAAIQIVSDVDVILPGDSNLTMPVSERFINHTGSLRDEQISGNGDGVRVDARTGRILMALGMGEAGSGTDVALFTVFNSTVNTSDIILLTVNCREQPAALVANVNRIFDGEFVIRVQNYSTTATSAPVSIHFVVIKTQ